MSSVSRHIVMALGYALVVSVLFLLGRTGPREPEPAPEPVTLQEGYLNGNTAPECREEPEGIVRCGGGGGAGTTWDLRYREPPPPPPPPPPPRYGVNLRPGFHAHEGDVPTPSEGLRLRDNYMWSATGWPTGNVIAVQDGSRWTIRATGTWNDDDLMHYVCRERIESQVKSLLDQLNFTCVHEE